MKDHKSPRRGLGMLLALLAGAASLSPTIATAQGAQAKSCFWTRNVDRLRSINGRTAYVRVRSRDVYELKLFAPCLNVSWSHGATLRSRGSSQVCEGGTSWLEIYARATGSRGGTQRCRVSEVRKLTADEVAALPSGARP
jgi:hypothetical protein